MDSINLSSTTLGFNNLGFNKLWLNNPHIQQCLDWTIYFLTTLTFNKIVESECCWIRGLLNPSIFKPTFVESKDCEIQDWWIQWLLNHRLLITRVVESKDCWIKGYLNVRFCEGECHKHEFVNPKIFLNPIILNPCLSVKRRGMLERSVSFEGGCGMILYRAS